MIVVTVELWPGGNKKLAEHLGTARIWNDCTGTKTMGNYQAVLSKRGMPDSTWKGGSVQGFPRKRLLAWDLLYRVLCDIVGGRG